MNTESKAAYGDDDNPTVESAVNPIATVDSIS
jgi:hypothetical protein